MKISTKNITEYLNSSNKNFKIFDIAYSKDDEKAISNLEISTYKTYNHIGKFDKMIGLNKFIQEIGSNSVTTANKIEKIINNLIKKVLSAYNKDYYWLTIRVTMLDSYFDIPRWHKDGPFAGFTPEDNTSKFLTVLKGPGTLAIKQTKEVDEIFHKIKNAEDIKVIKLIGKKGITFKEKMDISIKVNNEFRPKYAKALSKFKVLQPTNNQAILFYTKSTLHSEPKMDAPRLFISILPGSKANIEGLDKAWNKK
jgi:hypothetical protein